MVIFHSYVGLPEGSEHTNRKEWWRSTLNLLMCQSGKSLPNSAGCEYSRGSGLPPVSHAKNIVFVDGFPLSPPSPCTLGEGHERSEPHRWAVQISAESWTENRHGFSHRPSLPRGGVQKWPITWWWKCPVAYSLCLSISIYGGSQFKLMESGKTPIWLVVTGTWILFFHILGISSSQLTNSIIFQRGRWKTTNQQFTQWVFSSRSTHACSSHHK